MRGGRRIQEDLRSRLTIGFRFANVKMQLCHWPRMDPRIRNLPSTTFGGERLSRRAITEMQETVRFFPELSRTKLVQHRVRADGLAHAGRGHPPGLRPARAR